MGNCIDTVIRAAHDLVHKLREIYSRVEEGENKDN